MNISKLFKELENYIADELNGELILEGNRIVWSYDLDRDGATQDIEAIDDDELEFRKEIDDETDTYHEFQDYDEDLNIFIFIYLVKFIFSNI